MRREHRGPQSARGIAAVEFIIAVPVLLVLMLVMIEMGRALVQYDALTYAVRHGARYVSENAIDGTSGHVNLTDEVVGATKSLTTSTLLSNGIIRESGGLKVEVEQVGADNVRVTATYPYTGILGLGSVLPDLGAGGGPISTLITFNVAVTMRAIY
jgi:Flp pilus assembly protein TadG